MGYQPFWMGTVPPKCDFCLTQITTKFIDGAVPRQLHRLYGSWAYVCPSCFSNEGMTLGIGRGQEYTRQADGRFLKTGG